LFADLRVLRLEIDIPEEGMETLRAWHWRQGSLSRPNVHASVREGATVYQDVAVQLKGSKGSFRSIDDRPGLTLRFDTYTPGQRFHGLKKLSLNNSVQDPSLVSEKICRELFLEAGVPAPRAAHALVKLNGRDLGLYVLVEGFNRQFLKRHFANTAGNLFDGGFVQDIDEDLSVNSGDDPQDRSALDRLVEAAAELDDGLRLEKLEAVLDLERFLTFTAVEAMTCHWDGYTMNRNNYRIFHDLDSGRLIFLPHGLDQTFGRGRGSTSQSVLPHARGRAAHAVLQAPEGRRMYLETLARLYRQVFHVERILRRADEIAAPIQDALAETDPDRMSFFLYHLQSFKDAVRERSASIAAQLANPEGPPVDPDPGPGFRGRRRWR